jgi:Cdc6-like AAA superfamily ATPase
MNRRTITQKKNDKKQNITQKKGGAILPEWMYRYFRRQASSEKKVEESEEEYIESAEPYDKYLHEVLLYDKEGKPIEMRSVIMEKSFVTKEIYQRRQKLPHLDSILKKMARKEAEEKKGAFECSLPPNYLFIKGDLKANEAKYEYLYDKWVDCPKTCFSECSSAILAELNSTAYVLRTIVRSVLTDSNMTVGFRFKIKTDFEETKPGFEEDVKDMITGKWERDHELFDLVYIRDNQIVDFLPESDKKGRLIMGFGPSGSGKTHTALEIIRFLRCKEIPNIPELFLTLDGSIYRKSSVIYQKILRMVKQYNLSGVTNLVAPIFTSIFDSSKTNKDIIRFLTFQKETPLYLYVPETLGGCRFDCASIHKKYVALTEDIDWIGIFIYQHRSNIECPYQSEYKCIGCIEIGKEREVIEGKKYSSDAWGNSMTNGNAMLMKAPRYRFRIHNGGTSEKKTIIEDLSTI